jgi:hypothetical protein
MLTRENFDWNEFLALQFHEVSYELMSMAHDKASAWPTCACGQLCRGLPREYGIRPHDAPTDYILRNRGTNFTSTIASMSHAIVSRDRNLYHDCRDQARMLMGQIEARTTQLLNEQQRPTV